MLELNMIMYLERQDVTSAWEIEKAEKGDAVMSTSTRLFKGRVVKDSEKRKENLYLVQLQLLFYLQFLEEHLQLMNIKGYKKY